MNATNRLRKIDIPSYSFKQELFNSISHFIGAPLGLFIIIIASVLSIKFNLPTSYLIGLLIFGLTTIILYTVSGIYHIGNPAKENSKKIKRIIDHCTIYLLIAGTYAPICLYIGSTNYIGYVILGLQWGFAIIGIILNAIDLTNKVVKTISMILYLLLGWMIIFTPAFLYIPLPSFIWILIGGILYTIGSITYGIGHKNLNFHGVFHIFVLLGTITQAIGVILLFI